MKNRPDKIEYDPYFERYVKLVDETGSRAALDSKDFLLLIEGFSEDQWNYSYAPHKWTLKEVVIHIMDTERIFAYRALRISRNDLTPLVGFEQDGYVENAGAKSRPSASIISEYKTVRAATMSLYNNLEDSAMSIIGTASGVPISVLALAYMIAGHQIHHKNIIVEKYLK